MSPAAFPGGTLEHGVLATVWKLKRASIREVQSQVGAPSGLAYTTTATVLDRLHRKGLVSRKRVGRTFVYAPKAKQQTVERARARHALRQLLGPDPQPAITALVDALGEIDPDLLDELARAVQARRKTRRGS
jgi:predicted transcriptional regulator